MMIAGGPRARASSTVGTIAEMTRPTGEGELGGMGWRKSRQLKGESRDRSRKLKNIKLI